MELSLVEWSGVEWRVVEWSGVEWTGLDESLIQGFVKVPFKKLSW